MPSRTTAFILVLFTTVLTTFAQLLFKQGAVELPLIFTNFSLIVGVITYILGAALLIYALKGGEVSTLYPVTASSYIWVTILAWYFFHESISLSKLAGLAFILIGVLILAYAAKKTIKYEVPV